jgi:hypothetical protein
MPEWLKLMPFLTTGRDVALNSPFSNEQSSPSASNPPTGRSIPQHLEKTVTANVPHTTLTTTSTSPRNNHDMGPHHTNTHEERLNPDSDTFGDELTAMSHALLGPQFAEMDRVFTLNGTEFTFDMGGSDAMGSYWGN